MDHETATAAQRGQSVKSASAFRTISEVSDELDVPQHVLRFWETRFSQIKPLKRGGGRRYYRPEDLALLRRIRDLLYTEGYTIRGVQRLLRQTGVKALLKQSAPDVAAGFEADPLGESAARDAPVTEGGAVVATAAIEAAATPSAQRLDPETRRELQEILAELTELRALLGRKGG